MHLLRAAFRQAKSTSFLVHSEQQHYARSISTSSTWYRGWESTSGFLSSSKKNHFSKSKKNWKSPQQQHSKPNAKVLSDQVRRKKEEIDALIRNKGLMKELESNFNEIMTGPNFDEDYTYLPSKKDLKAEDHECLLQELNMGLKERNVDNFLHLFKVLSAKGHAEEMEKLLDQLVLESEEFATCEPLFTTVIAGYATVADAPNAIRMLGKMKELKVPLSEWSYYSAIHACARANKFDWSYSLLHRMNQSDGLTAGPTAYAIIMRNLIRHDQLEKAWDLFHLMRQEVTDPDVYVFNTLIDGYAQRGYVERCISLFEDMRSQGLRPTVVTYNCIIKACSHSSYYCDKAFLWFERLKTEGFYPDEYTYLSLLHSCSRYGDIEKASQVIAEMEKHEFPIGEPIYNILFNTYARANVKFLYSKSVHRKKALPPLPRPSSIEGPMKLFSNSDEHTVEWEVQDDEGGDDTEMEERELNQDNNDYHNFEDEDRQDEKDAFQVVVPQTNNNLIEYEESWVQAQNRRMDEADALLEDMIQQGIDPSLKTLNSWMNVAASGRRVSRVLRCVSRFEEFGKQPDMYTYRSLVRMYARGRHVDKAQTLLDTIRKENIPRDPKTFGYMIELNSRLGNVQGAMNIIEEMHDENIPIEEKYLKRFRKLAKKHHFQSSLIPEDPDAWLHLKPNRPYKKKK